MCRRFNSVLSHHFGFNQFLYHFRRMKAGDSGVVGGFTEARSQEGEVHEHWMDQARRPEQDFGKMLIPIGKLAQKHPDKSAWSQKAAGKVRNGSQGCRCRLGQTIDSVRLQTRR